MTKQLRTFVLSIVCVVSAGALLRAQDKPIIPLQVQIVISRYQGERKISSLPYTLVVNANLNKTSLRLGSQVPIVSTSYTPTAPDNKDAKPAPLQSYQYKQIGTNIDCTARTLPDGRFQLDLAVDDQSVYSDDRSTKAPAGVTIAAIPSFLSFTSTNTVILKDGQSMQYTTATDKVTGEVTKLDVTLTVVK